MISPTFSHYCIGAGQEEWSRQSNPQYVIKIRGEESVRTNKIQQDENELVYMATIVVFSSASKEVWNDAMKKYVADFWCSIKDARVLFQAFSSHIFIFFDELQSPENGVFLP